MIDGAFQFPPACVQRTPKPFFQEPAIGQLRRDTILLLFFPSLLSYETAQPTNEPSHPTKEFLLSPLLSWPQFDMSANAAAEAALSRWPKWREEGEEVTRIERNGHTEKKTTYTHFRPPPPEKRKKASRFSLSLSLSSDR